MTHRVWTPSVDTCAPGMMMSWSTTAEYVSRAMDSDTITGYTVMGPETYYAVDEPDRPKRVKCPWCGQRILWEMLDCPHCGGYQDEVEEDE